MMVPRPLDAGISHAGDGPKFPCGRVVSACPECERTLPHIFLFQLVSRPGNSRHNSRGPDHLVEARW